MNPQLFFLFVLRPSLSASPTTASEIGDAIAGDKPSPRPLSGALEKWNPQISVLLLGMRIYFERATYF